MSSTCPTCPSGCYQNCSSLTNPMTGTCWQICNYGVTCNCLSYSSGSDFVCMNGTWYLPTTMYAGYDYVAIKFVTSLNTASTSASTTAYDVISWYYGVNSSSSDVTDIAPTSGGILNATTIQNANITISVIIIEGEPTETIVTLSAMCSGSEYPVNPY